MSEAFLKVVNMSISAGWLVLAVLALRLILKKAPKWVNVLLWGIVAVRLICPFSIESALSLIPSRETISPEIMMDWTPEIATGIAPLDRVVNPVISTSFAPQGMASANPLQILIPVAANLWLLGVLILLVYTAISYLTLRHKLRTAVILRDNIFHCETVSSPFVLGILKPRIYLPYAMDGKNLAHVIAHEQAHIRRKDHWWKPLGFLLLTVYWFNPLIWVAYILLCRDIELACDEKVIAELGNEQRADYTQALVACAVNRRMIAACPLAFGEVSVKERIRSVMNYKKPTFWIIVTALVVCVVVAVCFLTNPKDIKTPMHIIDTLSTEDVHWSQITIWEDESTHILLTDEQIQDLMGILKDLNDRDFLRSRGIERNVSLMINCGEIELLLHWDGEYTAFYFDAATHELVDQEYCYVKSNELNLFLSQFYPIQVGISRPEVKWFDYTENPSNMSYDRELKIRLEDFPGITFKYTPHGIVAAGEDEASADETMLISGLPVWSAYFCDLTGDGKPEICSQVSYGSGIIDNRVIIFDYANGVSYKLEDRGYHDYYLRMEGAYLHVDKKGYNSDDLVSSGRLVFKDGCIQIEGVENKPEDITVNHDYFKWDLFENKNEDIVGIISSFQNMEPAMTQNGDILIIQNEGGLWHFVEGQQFDVSIKFENDGSDISMKSVGYIFCGEGSEGLYTQEIFADQNVDQSSGSFTVPETGNYLFYFRNYSSSWLSLQNFDIVYRNDLDVDRLVMVHSEEQWNPSAEATITNSEEIYYILSLYQSMQVEDYSRPLSEERIVIQFYRGEDIVQDWTVSYYAEDDTVVTCSDRFGLGNRRVTSDFSYDMLLRLFEEHAYTFIPAYEPLGVSGNNVEELSRISDHVKWIDGLGIDELAPGKEIVSDFVIDVEEDGTDLLITITWGAQDLILKYGIRAEDGTEFFQEKPGGSSMLRMKDIPAGTYRLFVRNSEAYAGTPAYENPEDFPDVSFNATGAILYAFDN